jgi:hypothetical protein
MSFSSGLQNNRLGLGLDGKRGEFELIQTRLVSVDVFTYLQSQVE